MKNGKIGVTTENIFPIIKKFLYSDHEIFLRELISNAIDATQKLKALSSVGEFKGELGELKVKVSIDKENGTLTVSDSGIGMTADEIEKYINQIAFSGAEEFLEKYKDKTSIIGHFGLGFYSSFMVSEKVEIRTRSHKEGSQAVKWSCDGTPEYSIDDIDKTERGTDIVLYIDEESKEFLEESKINELLNKYCKFLPVEVAFGKEKEWKDGKEVELDKDNIINDTNPIWVRKPSDLTDEDYKTFYRTLYPMSDEPLFWIHLNVDYPFNLTGVLYFPKINNNIEVQKNKIQLFCNQVFVTDSVEGIVPEFLTLLHGVIDSPDIPLNVSRSYLQSDSNVKKISNHITKKVADRLFDIFKEDRKQFEEKWDDLSLFIKYGMLSEKKFNERATKFSLLKNTDSKYFTFDEYQTLIKENQTDKNNTLIYLYATDREEQFTYIEAAKNKGYDVLTLDGHLDSHFVNHLEQEFKESRFVRVDSDIVDKLIEKDVVTESLLSDDQKRYLKPVFEAILPENANYSVAFENLSETDAPVLITQAEFMRRMKEMAAMGGGGGMNFYGEMPDSYNIVVNTNHPLVSRIATDLDKSAGDEAKKYDEKIKPIEATKTDIESINKDKKEDEIPQVDKDRLSELSGKIDELKQKQEVILKDFSRDNKLVKQVIDLALLSNNMLKGEELNKFIKRSIDLI
ncbi:MAG: molecular chaperone HtpG [Bacteroidales bacterium]|jgi:molecular chaperone HtpG|nr:molecular chaperone HtpG [Bacteroidales bacterium]